MKILHTADLHLVKYGDDRWLALEKLIDIAKRENAEVFVVSGDLFDKSVDAEKLRPKIREVFSNTDFPIVMIAGNHDSESYKGGMYFGEKVVVVTDPSEPFNYKELRIW